MNQMAVMNEEGHTQVTWDPTNPESVEIARTTFEVYSGRGFRAYSMSSKTHGDQLSEFDPSATDILFMPPFQGG